MNKELIQHNQDMDDLIEDSNEVFNKIQDASFNNECDVKVTHAMVSLLAGTVQAYISRHAMVMDMEQFDSLTEKEQALYSKTVMGSGELIRLCMHVLNSLASAVEGGTVDLTLEEDHWVECMSGMAKAKLSLSLGGRGVDADTIASLIDVTIPAMDSLGKDKKEFKAADSDSFQVKTSGSMN